MIGGRFLQFFDRDELCDAPPDTPLFASISVKNALETKLSIGFSTEGSIVSMPERSLSLVTMQLDFSTVAFQPSTFKIQDFIC